MSASYQVLFTVGIVLIVLAVALAIRAFRLYSKLGIKDVLGNGQGKEMVRNVWRVCTNVKAESGIVERGERV